MVSIIVVTSDNPEEARLCLKSLAEFTPEEHEVIATQPPFHELDDLVTGQDNIRFVRKECARNPFSVKNRVAAEARGKYLLFMDGSTVVTPGWLTNMLSCIENTGAGIVGPLCSQAPVGGRSNRRNPCKWRPTVSVGSDAMLIGRELFHEARGFDEVLCPGRFQDDDICLKAALLGRTVYLAGDTLVHNSTTGTHSISRSSDISLTSNTYASPTIPSNSGYPRYVLDSTANRFCAKWGVDDPNFPYPRPEFFETIDPRGKRVLDLRCRAGANLLRALWEGAESVTGLEADRGLKKVALTHLSGNGGAPVFKEMKDIPSDLDSQGKFDLVLAQWCLEASTNPRRFLRQTRAVMADNSHMVAIIRNSWSSERILPLLLAAEPRTYPRPAWGPTASPEKALGWFWDSGFQVTEVRFLNLPDPETNPLTERLLSIPRDYAQGKLEPEPEPGSGTKTPRVPGAGQYTSRPYCPNLYAEEFMLIAEPMSHPRRSSGKDFLWVP